MIRATSAAGTVLITLGKPTEALRLTPKNARKLAAAIRRAADKADFLDVLLNGLGKVPRDT